MDAPPRVYSNTLNELCSGRAFVFKFDYLDLDLARASACVNFVMYVVGSL